VVKKTYVELMQDYLKGKASSAAGTSYALDLARRMDAGEEKKRGSK
jgi:hypothetical protein